MPIRVDTAAKYLCAMADWSLSNLPLQKLLYLTQVECAHKNNGAALLNGNFQAWDYGPVIPSLYGRLKMFGADPVGDVFYDALRLRDGSQSKIFLDEVWDKFGSVSPGELIELTHWDLGAWAKKYEPGIKGIPITQRDIWEEARNRDRFSTEWNAISGY
jgi:uncharacterized phage-associated protein